eukprot:CAMPEP_0117656212 /NCGR_PEP_ID=MMETSP0804-20121206/4686_1 /TAXON_ID=1074897 /ORGANISM="Tetraselmis astigmatica, Strain CCMP880" /LENGTH=468 /DNA_ID=CAMNT_0005462603 /DNA_START=63 /DNA_END=1470 /DNA_ORIENTATION=-
MEAVPAEVAAPVVAAVGPDPAAVPSAAEPTVGEKRPLDVPAVAKTEPAGDAAAAPVVGLNGAGVEAPSKRQQVSRPQSRPGNRETVYRLLAPSKYAGYIIGKGGSLIKQIREETGARLKVVEGVLGSEERPVVISSKSYETYEDCPAQAATMVMYQKLVEAHQNQQTGDTGVDGQLRMLVAQTQAGCLIGKAGVFIKQIRETTGANVRVLPPEELPLCALANDRVVQINGTQAVIEAALKVIARKLWENPAREPPGGPPPCVLSALGQAPPGASAPMAADMSYMQTYPLGGLYGAAGMPLQQYSAAGGALPLQQAGGGAFGGGGQQTKRTIMVPNTQVGLIIGSKGANIALLRQQSGAQIKVAQQQPGGPVGAPRSVEISGLPHQVSAAENMIRAAAQSRGPLGAPGGMDQQPQMWGMDDASEMMCPASTFWRPPCPKAEADPLGLFQMQVQSLELCKDAGHLESAAL